MAQNLSMPDIPVITIEAEQLFAATQFGQRVAKELEARGTQLAAENRRIEADLEKEEGEITAKRAVLEPEAFRNLADAFDARVQQVRAEQDEKARELARASDQAQFEFLQAIAPILEIMMNERGASVILDRRAVFLSADASDITQQAIARIDAELGDGTALNQTPDAPTND
ncbi:MAG: OmpH family outer membrane protein [Pseudomonadota bacterium]